MVDQKKLGKEYAAILAARSRAETHEPPFQPIGLEAVASSPSCQQTRPPLGQIIVRANSYLASQLKSGDSLKLIRKDGMGRPVVGTVNLALNMPPDTDIYLNRVQMIDFLASASPNIAVRAIVTDELPNQNSDDHYPSDVQISCAHG